MCICDCWGLIALRLHAHFVHALRGFAGECDVQDRPCVSCPRLQLLAGKTGGTGDKAPAAPERARVDGCLYHTSLARFLPRSRLLVRNVVQDLAGTPVVVGGR